MSNIIIPDRSFTQSYEFLLRNTCLEPTEFNYIILILDYQIVCLVINDTVEVLLNSENNDEIAYYQCIFEELQKKQTTKEFFILTEDELSLVNLYKKFHIESIKKWFVTVPKVIDRASTLPFNNSLLETIAFELRAYKESTSKQSRHFYFVELLLQHLEEKIALSTKYKNDSTQIDELLNETDYQLCFKHVFPATQQTVLDSASLNAILTQKLADKGIDQVYAYQQEAFENILAGKSVVITAPTGNGKTESFLLPVIQQILQWKKTLVGVKAILFYPTKALATDQLVKITYYTKGTGIKSVQLDSDVTKEDREGIYSSSEYDLLITTPDFIHYSMGNLTFQTFLAATKIIIFDEVHTYTGTFGTHVYYFLRRLERILHEGKNVQFIAASATIANPVEFTTKLFSRGMVHVDCDTPKKNITELYCIQRKKTTSKQEVVFQLVSILTNSMPDEKILVFRNSQQEAEKTAVMLQKLKQKKIALHRAGLTKEQRTAIEKHLRENELDVVVTTTTLEVGIDIGGITTIITSIVPVNRLLQRIGRAGRGERPAKIFLELEHDPISYYYATHADAYLKDVGSVNITTENESIALQHQALEENPKAIFSLRNVNEKIEVRTENGYKLTEKELPQAFYEYFPLNHILHNGEHFIVERIEKGKNNSLTALVRRRTEKYDYKTKIRPIVERKVYTNSRSVKVEFIEDIEVKLSECKIDLEYQGNIVNYKEQVLTGTYNYEYISKCTIFNFEDKMNEYVEQERKNSVELGSIVHTLSHVLYKAAKMIIHCGNDLLNMENSIGMWKIVFVDNAINGNGMSELFFEKREEIWKRALEILHDCRCGKKIGCIKCTMDYGCSRKNKGLLKVI